MCVWGGGGEEREIERQGRQHRGEGEKDQSIDSPVLLTPSQCVRLTVHCEIDDTWRPGAGLGLKIKHSISRALSKPMYSTRELLKGIDQALAQV